MQITVHVSDEILHAAEAREATLTDFVEDLMARGLETLQERPALASAIERIRALRSGGPAAKP